MKLLVTIASLFIIIIDKDATCLDGKQTKTGFLGTLQQRINRTKMALVSCMHARAVEQNE